VDQVEIDVPRDRDASFEPKIVAKRQRRLVGVDDLVISLVGKGLTAGELQAHLGRGTQRRGVPGNHQQHHRPGATLQTVLDADHTCRLRAGGEEGCARPGRAR